MKEEHVILCSPPSEDGQEKLAGTRTDACHDCGAAIRVAPSSYQLMAEKGAILVCNDCGLKRALSDNADFELRLFPGQIEELKQHGMEDPEGVLRELQQRHKRRRS